MRGGYRIIDLAGTPLTSGTQDTIKGVYDAVKNPYKKATMVSGMVVGDVAYPEFYAPFVENSETYVTSVVIGGATISIEVAEQDKITVTVTEDSSENS